MDMEHFHYDRVPPTFLHCITDDCPLQAGCLRWIVYRHMPAEVEFIRIISPRKIASLNKNSCPYFFKVRPVRYAKGFKHVFDTMPYKEVQKLKKDLIAYFGRTNYYRCFREERLVRPEEQKVMQQIFENRGFFNTLNFRQYIDSFDFSPMTFQFHQAETSISSG